jgi:hypothetical protein
MVTVAAGRVEAAPHRRCRSQCILQTQLVWTSTQPWRRVCCCPSARNPAVRVSFGLVEDFDRHGTVKGPKGMGKQVERVAWDYRLNRH